MREAFNKKKRGWEREVRGRWGSGFGSATVKCELWSKWETLLTIKCYSLIAYWLRLERDMADANERGGLWDTGIAYAKEKGRMREMVSLVGWCFVKGEDYHRVGLTSKFLIFILRLFFRAIRFF